MDILKKKTLCAGLELSALGLGTVKFGRNEGVKYPEHFELPSEDKLFSLLKLAQSLGINTLDTAPSYGQSEERLGRLLTGWRNDWVIIGKAGEDFVEGKSTYNFTPDHFKYSLERSLKRLGTDYLDMLLIHSNGNDTEILQNDALIRTLHDFKKQNLVKALGASTKTVDGGVMALELLDTVMATYNAQYIDEKPVLDYALKNNKKVLLKKALSSGHNTHIKDAFSFAFSHPAVATVIVGTINPDHLRQNVEACADL